MEEQKAEGYSALQEPHYDTLQPENLRLYRAESGKLRLDVADDRTYLDVKVVRAFPLSLPDAYLTFLDAGGGDKVIGHLPDPGELDAESLQTAEDALGRHYFIPTITRIHSMREEFGAIYCDVETDRGRREFVARGIRDVLQELGGGELMIPDVDGNRYRVANWHAMDPHSRRLLERVV
jgi:hypothetical protein